MQPPFWKNNIYTRDILKEKISVIISKYLKHLLLSTMLYNKILFRVLNLCIMATCNHNFLINTTLVKEKHHSCYSVIHKGKRMNTVNGSFQISLKFS